MALTIENRKTLLAMIANLPLIITYHYYYISEKKINFNIQLFKYDYSICKTTVSVCWPSLGQTPSIYPCYGLFENQSDHVTSHWSNRLPTTHFLPQSRYRFLLSITSNASICGGDLMTQINCWQFSKIHINEGNVLSIFLVSDSSHTDKYRLKLFFK